MTAQSSEKESFSNKLNFDSQMHDITLTQFDETGAIKNFITAATMTHFEKQDRMLIDNPVIVMHKPNKQAWTIRAKTGKSINNMERIDLSDDVYIKQPSGPNNTETIIETQALTVYPEKDFAETKAYIVITQPDVKMQSTGMIADFKTKKFTLLKNARGQYAG